MSKILILAGSPRKGGNTDRLVEAFVKGACDDNTIEIVSVADYKVNPCIGCNSCFTREENRCFQNDDMTKIYEKLAKADTVIIASPVYFYGISAQLKAIVDRLHTPMRNGFNIKKLGLILVGAAELPELFDSMIAQYRLVLNFFKLEDVGMVLVRGAREKGDVGKKDLDKAFNLGKSITCKIPEYKIVKAGQDTLIENIDKVHTTDMGADRIKRNLGLKDVDAVKWCKEKILDKNAVITRQGKNWYVKIDNIIITVNAHSYTIITAHRGKSV